MTIVAIHQPNYLPWLGYFWKIARADIFVFLDDTQFSKGGYTNRVQIAAFDTPRWMTLPVTHAFGDTIDRVGIAKPGLGRAHLDVLFQTYRDASARRTVWPFVEALLGEDAELNLARRNEALVEALARRLGGATRFVRSSELGIGDSADERLANIVERLAPGGIYLSGKGAKAYQSETTFAARGVTLRYSSFSPAPYPRGAAPFVPGLSILDALFHLGFDATAELLRP